MEKRNINVPLGWEFHSADNDVVTIRERKEELSYDEIAQSLFQNHKGYFISAIGEIEDITIRLSYACRSNCLTEQQANRMLVYNQLMNIAAFFEPNPQMGGVKYTISIGEDGEPQVIRVTNHAITSVLFSSPEIARRAIQIITPEIIKQAFSDYE